MSKIRFCFLSAGVVGIVVAPARAQFGVPITDPAPLNVNAGSDGANDFDPHLAADGQGHCVAVWRSDANLGGTLGTDFDIFFARSMDYGVTWTPPAALNSNAGDGAFDDTPQALTDGQGHWLVAWMSDANLSGSGSDFDILFARSANNGATWSNPAALNTNAGADSGTDGRPRLATDGQGHWLAVWESDENLGGIGVDGDILLARSTDNGATWTAPAPLNTNAAVDSGADFHVRIAADGLGVWLAVWDSSDDLGGTIGLDLDILFARSMDDGATWTAPAALNTNAGPDSGSDESPHPATDGQGNWAVAWASDENLGGNIGTDIDILVARSTDDGATWTDPAPLNTIATFDSGVDIEPQLATDAQGNWVAAWESTEDVGGLLGTDRDILVARSEDDGATWTAPVELNTSAEIDVEPDYSARLITDGLGNWIGVWVSEHHLGGSIGVDPDILIARFALPDCNNNGAGDGQDIADGHSADCNGNGVPDECDTDANGDGTPDDCQQPACCGGGLPALLPLMVIGWSVLRRRR